MSRLMVMRHAKAEQFAASDHARELTTRGRSDAAAAGRWAREFGVVPDYVVVSSASRTQQTWTAFLGGLAPAGGSVPPEIVAITDRALYAAGTEAALEILHTVREDAGTVMLLGHNPTMELLVHLLDDGGADPDIFARVSAGYPTAALAVLEVPCPWADLQIGAARITDFVVGRG